MTDTVRATVSPLRKENSVLPRGGNVRLADLADARQRGHRGLMSSGWLRKGLALSNSSTA